MVSVFNTDDSGECVVALILECTKADIHQYQSGGGQSHQAG